MLRSSVGAFRALLEFQAPSQGALQAGARQAWKRGIAYGGAPNLARTRVGTAPQRQMLGRRIQQRPSALVRIAPPRKPFSPPRRTFHSTRTRNSEALPKEKPEKPNESLSLSARLKKLSREYGWTAVGVYISLSVLDFPFCFLLVRTLGTDRIAAAEHFIFSNVEGFIPNRVKDFWQEYRKSLKETEKQQTGDNHISEEAEAVGWGVKEAEERNKTEASLATQLALAYAIHKSFIFIRVPLVAAHPP